MRFLILGPLEVRGEQGAVALSGNKLRGLLAVLLLHANKPVSAEQLARALWGQDAPRRATKTVQVHVSRLRKALGDADVIATVPAGYCLRVRPDELDAAQFERLVEDGHSALADGRPANAGALLREALSLWRGPALAELACEPFAPAEITRLEEQRLAALEARVEADLAAGRHAELVGELRRLVAGNPTRERLTGQLMLALYRSARQTDALEAYQDTRRALIAGAGVEPGPQLRALQEAILRHDAALASRAGAPDRSPALDAATVPPVVGCEEEPVVLALPRSLHVPVGSAFVGRDPELRRLRERWTRVHGGTRSAVVISGEPGIGKTRLASELAQEVHQQGALVLYGRCDEGLAVPYQPFAEALRPYARAASSACLRGQLGDLASDLGRLLPELGGLGQPSRADPESERFALFEAVAALLEAMTRRRRVLLVVDDLHWAANPTLLLLRHLIRSERPLNMLLLCTYRATELDLAGPLARCLADLHRDGSTERWSIRGLDEAAIAALLDAVGSPMPGERAELVRVVGAQTAGNPFFIRELLAQLAETNAAQLGAPEGLRHVIGQRVARLSVPAGRALRVAAVARPTFSLVLLERVLGDESAVLEGLEESVAAGFLSELEHGEYVFAHALVRQTIYEQLSAARRMRLHRQLGEALETLDDAEAHIEALAHHFTHAAPDGQADKAAAYALQAGRNATARLGYEDAVGHYERGLQALPLSGQPQERRRCELLLALGEACWDAGELDPAREAYREAIELAETLRDTTALARAALGFDGPYRFEVIVAMRGPITGLLERALAALDEDDTPLRAQLLGRLAAHSERQAPELARQALQMARRIADKATLADVLTSCLWATRGPDVLHESLAITREFRDLAHELGDRRLEAMARVWLVDFQLELGDIDGVECELESLQRLAETRKDSYVAWLLAQRQANHALLCGRVDDCETLAHDVRAHDYEGSDATAMLFGAQMCFVRREQGRLDELIDDVERFAEHYSDPLLPGWRCALASMHAQLGHTAQARQQVDALARADFEDLPRDAFWLSNLSMLSEAVAILGDTARARLLHTMLSPYADRCVVALAVPCSGSACRYLGLLATTLARYDDAERHFEQAMKINAQIRSPLWIAHTQHDYARMLLLRHQPGDSDRAIGPLTEALATAQHLKLTALAGNARPLKLAAEAAEPWLAVPMSAPPRRGFATRQATGGRRM